MAQHLDVNQRLREWMKVERIQAPVIRELTGISRSSISQIMTDKMGISLDVLKKIACEYDELNIRWLITGEGRMHYTYHDTQQVDSMLLQKGLRKMEDMIKDKDLIIKLLQERNCHDKDSR